MNERIQTEMVSRRKALSLLGLGAALGFTLSSALEPLEAEAQEAAPATPAPAATGTHGVQRRSARPPPPPAATPPAPPRSPCCPRRTSSDTIGDPSAFERQIARSDGFRGAYAFGRPRNARDRR